MAVGTDRPQPLARPSFRRRSQTVPEDISLTGRRKAWYEMTERMMEELDAAMTKNIYAHLADFVVN